MSKKLFILGLAFLLVFPMTVFAIAPVPQPNGNLDFEVAISNIAGSLFIIVIGVSVIMFIAAGYLFLISNGDPGKINLAKGALIWGIVGVTVAFLSSTIPWVIKSIVGV